MSGDANPQDKRVRQAPDPHARPGAGGLAEAELQRALLPDGLPVLPRVRLAARYEVAGGGDHGGDWFDAIALADGTLALAVGDVVGHGVPAIAAMGQFRAVLGELLAAERDPGAALARADGFAARAPGLRAATMALALLSPRDGTVRYVTFGHVPPLVLGAGGVRFLAGTGSGPLGTGSRPALQTTALHPGDLLVMVTDGVIRSRQAPAAERMADLARAARAAAPAGPGHGETRAADLACREIARSMRGSGGYADDVAIVAAEFAGEPAAPLRLTAPAEAGTVLHVRRAFAGWLDALDVAVPDANDLLLAVVEIVTNAVEHAYPAGREGAVEFTAQLCEDGTLECRVADHGRWQVPDLDAGHRGHGLMVAGQVVDEMRISGSPHVRGTAPGSEGTVVTLRRRLRRPAEITTAAGGQPRGPARSAAYRLDLDPVGASPRARVSGPVDGASADRLAAQLLSACRGGTLPITVDLTGISYLASAGIRAMFDVRDRLAAHCQDLTIIAAAGSPAHGALDLAGLPHASA